MKEKTTPLPFPLVQMTRTFLFLWIFTLPFGLLNDFEKLPPLIVIIFFATYGFVGLEMVAIELDDPFGDDPNDYDTLGLGQVVFEDIYISIYDIDGKDAAYTLKASMEKSVQDQVKDSVWSYEKYSCINEWKSGSMGSSFPDKSMIMEDALSSTIDVPLVPSQDVEKDSFNTLVASFEGAAYGEDDPLISKTNKD